MSTQARKHAKHVSTQARKHAKHVSTWARKHAKHVSKQVRKHVKHASTQAHKHAKHVRMQARQASDLADSIFEAIIHIVQRDNILMIWLLRRKLLRTFDSSYGC